MKDASHTTPMQQVRRRYRHAGAQLSAMHGWQIVNYGKDGRGTDVLARSSRSEADAWRNAARKL